MIEIELNYPPSANRYWRCFRNRMVPSKDAVAYKKHVQDILKGLEFDLTHDPVLVIICLSPKLTVKGEASKTCIDLDNALKVILDSLQGIIYDNDKQIKKIIAEYGQAKVNGGLKVQVLKFE